MSYLDAQGRPEIVMHPDVVRGHAAFRHQPAAGGAGKARPSGEEPQPRQREASP